MAPWSQNTKLKFISANSAPRPSGAWTYVRVCTPSARSTRSDHLRSTRRIRAYLSHVGAEIGRPVGLHYHYGTPGQLQHGENYARLPTHLGLNWHLRPLNKWPYKKAARWSSSFSPVTAIWKANAFVQELKTLKGKGPLKTIPKSPTNITSRGLHPTAGADRPRLLRHIRPRA